MSSQIKLSDIFYAIALLVIAIIYYWTTQLGFVFAWHHTNVSAVWPPSAVGFTVIYFIGYRFWPSIWFGAFLANATYFLSNPSFTILQVMLFSSLIAVGNTLEALVSCLLLKKLIGMQNPLHKVRNVLRFILVGMLGCAVSALIGSLTVCFSNSSFWNSYTVIWATWWLGDFSGLVTLVPIFWALGQRPFVKGSLKRALEFVASLGIFILTNGLIFNGQTIMSQTHVPITYLPFALMVWLTYRFGYWGAIPAILVTLFQDVQGTNNGFGPFVTSDLNTSLLLLQTFIVTTCGTVFLLATSLFENRQSQQEVSLREQRFRALVENSTDMIMLLNPTGMISYSSPSTEKVMGYKKEEHEGHNIFEFIHPEDEPVIIKELARIISHPGEVITAVTRTRHKNGSWRWVEGSGKNLLGDPAVGAVVVNYHDITERKQAEEILKNNLKQATRLADLGTLAAIVAHELRTPLGVIQMAAHNLKNKRKELAEDKHLENIQKKIWEGNRIIDNLLSYSRIKPPSYEPCAILTLLDECVANLAGQFQDMAVVVEKDYQVNRSFTIEADSNQIREVLLNVLNNTYQAIQNKNGLIKLTVQKSGDGHIEINIKDNGTGIDAENLDKIFQPFFTTKAKGTGLGLAICNEVINLHHGRLDIQSLKGQGTTVGVILPVTRAAFNPQ